MLGQLIRAATLLLALAAPAALAQDGDDVARDFGGDRFLAGGASVSSTGVEGDLFAAGERVGVSGEVGGAAHLAGRRVSLSAPVGDRLYAAGMDVIVSAPVAGPAALAGYDIAIAAPIGGNVRAFARHVAVTAEIDGSLLAAGDEVEIAAAIAGDADITASEIAFGPGAAIGGDLVLRGVSEERAAIPDGVVAGEVRYVPLPDDWRGSGDGVERMVELPGLGEILLAALTAFVVGVLIVAALALVAASLAPLKVEDAVERSFENPAGTFWAGCITLALLLGAALVLALTGIGAVTLPLFVLAAVLLCAAGYVLGAYALGARILKGPAGTAPGTFGPRLAAALLGALIAALVALVPFIGWLAVLAVVLFGIGTILPSRAQVGAAEA